MDNSSVLEFESDSLIHQLHQEFDELLHFMRRDKAFRTCSTIRDFVDGEMEVSVKSLRSTERNLVL